MYSKYIHLVLPSQSNVAVLRAQDLGHIFVRQRTPVVVRALVQALVERL